MRPERRVSPAEYDPFAELDTVGKIDLMRRHYHAARPKDKCRVNFINDVGFGDRVDLVEPYHLRVPPEPHLVAAANNVQVPDPRVVAHRQLFCPDKNIQVTDRHIVIDRTFAGVNNRQSDPHTLSDLVTKQMPVTKPLKKRREDRDNPFE